MNRTETTEEKEWREASHPRLVKRLEDQRTALADLNRHVQSLTAEIATLTAERDTLAAKCEQLQDALKDLLSGWRYIRQDPKHIDIYGVGWDRAQHGAEAAIAAQQEGRAE